MAAVAVPADDLPTATGAVPVDDMPGNSVPADDLPGEQKRSLGLVKGVGEAALSIASQTAALPVQAAVSVYELLTAPPGQKVSRANQATARVGQAMTYQPGTVTGKNISDIANLPGEKIGEFGTWLGDKTVEKTGSAGLGAAAAMVPVAAGVLLGEKAPGMVAKSIGKTGEALSKARVANAPLDAVAQATFRAGLKISPAEVGGQIAQTVRTVAGGPKLDKEVSAFNAGRVQELVKVGLKMHPQDVLDRSALEVERLKALEPYEALRATGVVTASPEYHAAIANVGSQFAKIDKEFPKQTKAGEDINWSAIEAEKGRYNQPSFSASGAIDAMRQLRKDAKTNLKIYDPEKNSLGLVQRQIADVLLDELDRHAGPQMRQKFVEARAQLAKIQTVEDAMVGDQVSATELARLYDNGKGRPLTDEFKTIAEAATRFKKSFQEVNPNEWHGYVSAVDYFFGGYGALALHNPAMLGVVIARPAARAALRSKPMQKYMTHGKSYEVGAVRKAVKSAGEKRSTAAASAAVTAGEEEQQ